jgi:hypothetical protein
MNETEYGKLWDISFDSEGQKDCVYIDTGDEALCLSKTDLEDMLSQLEGYDA